MILCTFRMGPMWNRLCPPWMKVIRNPSSSGDALTPTQVFLIIERRYILCAMLLEAVDLAFKLFYVTDTDYQVQCANTWLFIQHAVYQIKEGRCPPSVRDLCAPVTSEDSI